MRIASVLAAFTLLVTACGSSETPPLANAGVGSAGDSSTERDVDDLASLAESSGHQAEGTVEPVSEAPSGPGVVEPSVCEGDGLCVLGVLIDGVFHAVGCHPVIDEMVDDDVVATGDSGTGNAEIHAIVGVSRSVLLAGRGLCDDELGWTAVITPLPDPASPHDVLASYARELSLAICTALADPGAGDRCDQGGTADWWYATDAGLTVWNYEYFDSFVEQIETAPPDNPEKSWRLDPIETMKRTVRNGYFLGDIFNSEESTNYAVSIAEPAEDEVLIIVEGVLERRNSRDSKTSFEVTLERLIPSGQTWWVTSYTEAPLSSNADTDCCPILLDDTVAS